MLQVSVHAESDHACKGGTSASRKEKRLETVERLRRRGVTWAGGIKPKHPAGRGNARSVHVDATLLHPISKNDKRFAFIAKIGVDITDLKK